MAWQVTVPYEPNRRQALFHASPEEETVYGGAKGGGKSCSLVMEALAYSLEYAGATCYLFRETYDDLEANLINEWKEKVPPELYTYHESKHVARLRNGSRVLFRFIRNEDDAAKYQGRSMDWIGVDELTKHTKRAIQILLSCLRSPKGFPPRFRATCNPGGIGHGWVKEDYVEATRHGKEVVRDAVTGNRRRFVSARVYDNHVLMKNDPAYVKRLENLPPEEKKAFLYGDWDVFIGQVFCEWNRDFHVIDPRPIQKEWMRFRSMDWGFAKPYSIHWYAVDFAGMVYCYRELYGIKEDMADVGTAEDPTEVAKKVRELEKGEDIAYGVADPACWQEDERVKWANGARTVIDAFANEGVYWIKANNARISGKMEVHMRLRGHGRDRPGIRFFSTCRHMIRTLPALQYSKTHVEDVDTDMEDHAYDDLRYALKSQPWKPEPEKPLPKEDYGQRRRRQFTTAWSA